MVKLSISEPLFVASDSIDLFLHLLPDPFAARDECRPVDISAANHRKILLKLGSNLVRGIPKGGNRMGSIDVLKPIIEPFHSGVDFFEPAASIVATGQSQTKIKPREIVVRVD